MDQRPNILIVMCDQLNAGVLGCYGGPVPTPNIDRLAGEGVLFTDATCPTPFCSPSRASLITGLYPHAHGIVCNINRRDYPAIGGPPTEEGIRTDDATTEKLLHAAGYQTHQYGKWHLRDDDLPYYTDMFGEHHAYVREMADTFAEVRRRPRDGWMDWYDWPMPVTVSPALQAAIDRLGGRWADQRHAEFITKMGRLDLPPEQNFDVRVTDRTVERLRELGPKPFMVTASFNYPHDPNVVPSPYYEAFSPDEIELPANFGHREPRFEAEWSRQIVADLGDPGAREFLRIYYACVKLVDDQVGRILEALDATGRADDTIVVFTADHGDMAGGHGMVWKSTSTFYDEVARVPLIIRPCGTVSPANRADTGTASGACRGTLERGAVSDVPACLTDIPPTLLDLVDRPIPEHVQGHSLAPYLRGEADPARAPAFTFSERVPPNREHTREVRPGTRGSFMVRGGGWKYFVYADGSEFMYDLAADPGEITNLAADPGLGEQKGRLRAELDAWLAETGWPGG